MSTLKSQYLQQLSEEKRASFGLSGKSLELLDRITCDSKLTIDKLIKIVRSPAVIDCVSAQKILALLDDENTCLKSTIRHDNDILYYDANMLSLFLSESKEYQGACLDSFGLPLKEREIEQLIGLKDINNRLALQTAMLAPHMKEFEKGSICSSLLQDGPEYLYMFIISKSPYLLQAKAKREITETEKNNIAKKCTNLIMAEKNPRSKQILIEESLTELPLDNRVDFMELLGAISTLEKKQRFLEIINQQTAVNNDPFALSLISGQATPERMTNLFRAALIGEIRSNPLLGQIARAPDFVPEDSDTDALPMTAMVDVILDTVKRKRKEPEST